MNNFEIVIEEQEKLDLSIEDKDEFEISVE